MDLNIASYLYGQQIASYLYEKQIELKFENTCISCIDERFSFVYT